MKKLIFIAACFMPLVVWAFGSPQLDDDNWEEVNLISPEFGNSPELAEKFSHWPNYTGAYDVMGGAKAALRWCSNEASVNYEYRKGTYKPEDKRNYAFVARPAAKGAPRRMPSDPEWMKDYTECMEALGLKYVGPEE